MVHFSVKYLVDPEVCYVNKLSSVSQYLRHEYAASGLIAIKSL